MEREKMRAGDTSVLKFIEGLNKVFIINPDKFNDIVESNYLHKATKNKGLNTYDPIISKNKSDLNSSKKIQNIDFYVESNLSANMAIKYTKALLYEYKLDEKTQITIINNEEE